MPFDEGLWHAPATVGLAVGSQLDLSIAIDKIVTALRRIQATTGAEIGADLSELEAMSIKLFDSFKASTGWEPSDG